MTEIITLLVVKCLVSMDVFLNQKNSQQRHIKLIKTNSKHIYIFIKTMYFK